MGYPQGPPPQQGPPQGQPGPYGQQQGGWQQQGPPPQQGGWQQQGPPQGQGFDPYAQQGQGGYAPFQGGQPMGGGAGSYDWGTMYGMADHTVGQLIDKGLYTAIVKSADWDRTKDGSKSAWTIVFGLTSGPKPGMKMTMTMAVSPKKLDGTDNEQGMGILFRQLASMGIPVPPPYGQQGWWQMGWNEQQVGQAMVGKPVLLQVVQDEYDGVTRNKVRDIQPPPPGAPTQLPNLTQQQAPQPYGQQQGPPQGYQQGPPQQQPGQAPAPWQPPQQGPPQQPQFEGQGYGQGFGQQQGPPQGQGYAQGPPPQQWQQQQGPPPGQYPQGYQQQQQGPPQGYQGPPQGYDPSVPPHAQQANPGAPGTGQFTGQGQAWQPGVNPAQEQQAAQQMGQQPWANPNGMPGQQQQQQQQPPQQQPQGGEQGPPQAPGWAGGQPQQ
jgi:hypothetical protein